MNNVNWKYVDGVSHLGATKATASRSSDSDNTWRTSSCPAFRYQHTGRSNSWMELTIELFIRQILMPKQGTIYEAPSDLSLQRLNTYLRPLDIAYWWFLATNMKVQIQDASSHQLRRNYTLIHKKTFLDGNSVVTVNRLTAGKVLNMWTLKEILETDATQTSSTARSNQKSIENQILIPANPGWSLQRSAGSDAEQHTQSWPN